MTDEIHRIHDYLSGEATEEERRRLEAWLKRDGNHVDLFVREAFLHHALHEALRENLGDAPPVDLGRPSTAASAGESSLGAAPDLSPNAELSPDANPLTGANPEPGSSVFYVWASGIRPWLVPVFVTLMIAGAAFWLLRGPGQTNLTPSSPIARDVPAVPVAESVARVEEIGECVWNESSTFPRRSDARLSPGDHLNLASGTAQVYFDCGATVTLKGPALLAVDTPMDATLLRGDLRVNVPDEARGFLIHTDEIDVRDLGTEFKLNVDDGGQTNVEVVDGKVEASLKRQEKTPNATHSLGVGEFLRTGRDTSREVWDPARLSVFRGVRIDFTNPENLNLLAIVRENPDHYRYDPAHGCLSVDTTWGNVYGRQKPGENLFLLPAPQDADFDVVLTVASFVPERLCEHVGLMILKDTNNYARIIYALHRIQQRHYVQFNVETEGDPGSRAFEPVEFGAGSFQLRLVRRGSDVSGWWSRDGKQWTLRDRGKTPDGLKYVGFYASKGHAYPKDGTPYRQAFIEKFEIEIRDTSRKTNPNGADNRAIQ